MPLPSIHSTSLIPHIVVELGERALPPPAAVAWPQIVYGDCAPTHTDIHIIVCEALMCCRCRSVGRSVGRVCVLYGVVVVHTPGIAVCAAAAALLAAPLHREAAARHGTRSIQLCRVCAWTRSLISLVCVSHTHPRHHQLSPTPARMHMSSRACIPKVIYIYEHGTVCTSTTTHSFIYIMRDCVVNLYFPASSRATVPAEFKHINKRRKRNQQGFP